MGKLKRMKILIVILLLITTTVIIKMYSSEQIEFEKIGQINTLGNGQISLPDAAWKNFENSMCHSHQNGKYYYLLVDYNQDEQLLITGNFIDKIQKKGNVTTVKMKETTPPSSSEGIRGNSDCTLYLIEKIENEMIVKDENGDYLEYSELEKEKYSKVVVKMYKEVINYRIQNSKK